MLSEQHITRLHNSDDRIARGSEPDGGQPARPLDDSPAAESGNSLRQRLIDWILEMKNGNDKWTPQPDQARYAMRQYDEMIPWLDLVGGVREEINAGGKPLEKSD